jgi:TctA family transporter
LIFICLGTYSVTNAVFNIYVVAIVGALGYLMLVLRFDAAPLLLGFVLGPLMEENLRRAMRLSRGDPMTFLERPISASFIAVAAAILLWSLFTVFKKFLRARAAEQDRVM